MNKEEIKKKIFPFPFKKKKQTVAEPAVRPAEVVEDSLRSIYQEPEGEMPDLTKLERKKSYFWIWILGGTGAAILLLVGMAWAGFLFFRSFQGFDGKGLEIMLEGPEQIALGQETTYFINYRNPMRDPLAAAEIRINVPAEFHVAYLSPKPSDAGNVWRLGALAAEERGTIMIRGTFAGALDTITAIQAIATYRPANYSSDFEAMATKQIAYKDTVLQGWIEVPEKAVPGDTVSLAYHLKHSGKDPLANLRIRMVMPEGFTPNLEAMGTSTFEGATYLADLPSLSAGVSTTVALIGTFAAGYGGDALVTAETGLIGAEGQLLSMQKAEAMFPVLAGDLNINFIVNGSEQTGRSISYGENLHAVLAYENTADESLNNIKIRLNLETIDLANPQAVLSQSLINWEKIESSATATRNGTALIWDGGVRTDLVSLDPRATGEIELTIPVAASSADKGRIAVRATVEAEIQSIGQTELKRIVRMSPVIFMIASDAKLAAEARYFTEEGAPYGGGPIPPVVGQTTDYRVFWNIQKTLHALENIEVAATLPRSVAFIEVASSSAGELQFDESTRKLNWTINQLPEDVNEADMQFTIRLTPTAADEARFALLLDEITFEAMDTDINQPILSVLKDITTDLQNDEAAKGKGVVRKPGDN